LDRAGVLRSGIYVYIIKIKESMFITRSYFGYLHFSGSGHKILTNSVRFHFVNPKDIFKYAVTFSPELPSSKCRGLILQQFNEILGKQYIFDDLLNLLYLPVNIDAKILPKLDTEEDDKVKAHQGSL